MLLLAQRIRRVSTDLSVGGSAAVGALRDLRVIAGEIEAHSGREAADGDEVLASIVSPGFGSE